MVNETKISRHLFYVVFLSLPEHFHTPFYILSTCIYYLCDFYGFLFTNVGNISLPNALVFRSSSSTILFKFFVRQSRRVLSLTGRLRLFRIVHVMHVCGIILKEEISVLFWEFIFVLYANFFHQYLIHPS